MEQLMKVTELWNKLYPVVMTLSKEELLMLIGMAIDYNSSKNGGDPAEYIEILAKVSKEVNEQMGRAK